jgi:YD repeat-containing protein
VEQYWDTSTGTAKQLKRTQYRYNSADLVEEETVYDTNDQLRYSLQYSYDAKGNLIAKSDHLGRITRWTYDENKNKTSEELIGSGSSTLFRYDMAGRLIAIESIHDDGTRLINSFRYDYLGHKVAEVDSYGNETTFDYDGLGGAYLGSRIIKANSKMGCCYGATNA